MAILKNSRNILLSNAATRVEGATVTITTGGINTITVDAGSVTPNPASLTLTATTTLYTNPTFVWEFRYSNTGTWTSIGGNSNTLFILLNAAWLTAAGTNSLVQYRVTVTDAKFNTTTQIITFPILRSGASNISLAYSNDSANIPVASSGTINWAASGGELFVYEGNTALKLNSNTLSATYPTALSSYNLAITQVSGPSLTIPTITGANSTVVSVGNWGGVLSAKAVYRITAYVKNSGGGTSTVSVDVDLTPVTSGADAVVHYIWTNSPVIYKDSSNANIAGIHSQLQVQGRKVVGSTTSNFGWITITPAGGTEATVALDTSSSPYSFTPGTSSTATSYTIKLYNSATVAPANLLDTEVVSVVYRGIDGKNPVYIDLSNDNATIATDENGENGNYTLATTAVQFLDGTTSVLNNITSVSIVPSSGVTYSYTLGTLAAVTNRTSTTNLTGGTTSLRLQITNLQGADNGTLTINVVYAGQTYTAVFSVSKSKTGLSTPIYELQASSGISFNANTNSFTPTTLTFSALLSRGNTIRNPYSSGTVTVEQSDNGSTYTTVSGAGGTGSSTFNLSTSALATTTRFVRATLRSGNATSAVVDQETISVGVIGANAISPPIFEITNDNATVATATDGTGGDYSRAVGSVRFYNGNGTNLLSSATSVTVEPSSGVSFTYTLNGTRVTASRTTNLNLTGVNSLSVEITGISGQDNGTLTVRANYGGAVFSDTFTVSKVKAGTTGAPATVYEIESDGQFSFNPNTNTFTPTGGVTFTAYSITGSAARTAFSSGTITTAYSTDGVTWTVNGTPIVASTASISPNVLSASTRFVRAQLSVGGVVVDQELQPISIIGRDGTAAVLVDLTNDNVTIPTDADGSNGNYTNATTTVQLFNGVTSILSQATQIVLTPSAGVTFSYVRNGTSVTAQTTAQTLSGTTNSLTLTATNLASPNDTGSITVAATYLGTVYSTTFTISKAKAGAAGTSPTVYELDANGIFTFNSNTNTFTPSAGITYSAFRTTGNTARVAHTTGTITISKSLDGTNWTNIVSQTAGAASVAVSSLAATDKFIRAQLTVGGVIVDTETYPIVSIGKDGLTPVVVDLSNDSCAVATNTDGTGGNFANATTQVRINDASKTPSNVLGQLTSLSLTGSAGVTYSYTRNASAVSNLAGTSNPTITGMTSLSISVTAMTQDTGTVTVSAVYGGITYTKDFTVTKVKAGVNATTYEIEADSGILYNNVSFQPANVVFNAYSSSGNTARTAFSGGNIVLESSTDGTTWTAIGSTATNVSTRTLTTSSLSANVKQIRAKLIVSNVTVDQEIITISSTGINAVALDLTNETTVIPTDASGNNGNYSGATTEITFFSGTTNILKLATSITITPSTGITFLIKRDEQGSASIVSTIPLTATSPVPYLTLTNRVFLEVTNLTTDKGSLTVTAYYGGVNYEKVFSFAKAKTGPETLIYSIESSGSISFDPNTNNFSPASITYTGYSKSGNNNRVTPIAGASYPYINILTSTNGTTYSDFSIANAGSTYSFNTSLLPKTARFIKAQLYTAAGVVADEEIDAITVQGPAGTSGLSARIEPASIVLPADGAGTVTSYTLSVSKIFVYEGVTPLIYDGAGTTNGKYTVTATTQSNITAGAITVITEPNVGNIAQVGTASNMSTSDTAKITFTVTGKSALGTTFNFTLEQTFAKLKSGAKGDPGTPGAAGTSGVNLILSRPSTSVFAYANGNVPSSNYSGVDGYAKLYEGTTEVTSQATWSSAIYTGSGDVGSINNFNNSPVSGYGIGYYRLTNIGGLLGNSGALIIRALYKGTTYEAIFNVTKTLTGYEIVNALPTTNLFEGRMVFLTTDDKLYRYTGTAWTAAVPASDLSGQVLANQIADGAINTAKFASGLEPVSIVTSVPTTKSTSSVFNTTDGKLYRWTGTAYTATVPSSDISGTIQAAQLAGIEASKVTGQLTSAQIASLDAAKIAGQLANTQIAAVDATKLTGQLTNAQLAAIDAAKITGQVGSNQISAGAIIAGKIAANAVSANEIAAGAVIAGKIAANAVTANEIAANAITTNKIAANAITANQIDANAITSAKIAAGAITAGKIAADSITSNEIAANSITAAELAAGAVTAGKIAAGSIQAADIAAGAITAGKIAANAITATELAADAVTAGKIQAGAVNAAQIAAGAINADKIAAGAITTAKIAAGAITANEIAAGAITAGKIAAGAITADKIQAGSITAATLGVTSLSALTANTGTLTIGTDGNIKTTGGYFNGPGVFLGYDQNAYKFSVGAGGNSPALSFDGTSLTVPMFGSVERWKFNNAGPSGSANLQGWTLSGVNANFLTSSMELFPSSNDPVIVFGYNRPLEFSGGQYDKVRVRLRRKGGSGWDGTCYYATTAHQITGSYYKTIPNTAPLNQWVTLEWDMSQLSAGGSDWTNSTIRQLRLDFGNSASDVFEIDWIAIGRYTSGSIEEITAENSSSVVKTGALGTSQLGYEAVTSFRTATSTTKYTAAGLIMEYTFNVPEAGQIVAFWQGAAANMRFYRFHMYLNATPTTGRPAGYVFVGENQGSYAIYDDGYSGPQYISVGSGNGDYNYDTGSAPGAVPAQNIMATVRSGGVYEDAPVMIGTAQAKAGNNTVYIWLSEYNGGEIQQGDATNPSQKLIVFTAKR